MVRVPILGGRLRGRWWLPTSGGKILRVLGGTYEREQTALFERWLAPGDTLLDVGAHVGYYTLLAAELVGPSGAVYAFEPDPRNVLFLRRHVRINRAGAVQVLERAVSDRVGTVRFQSGAGSGTGRIGNTGALEVRTTTVDAFVAERGIRPSALKIEGEGAEARVLHGAAETLRLCRPVVFLSTHGPEVHRESLGLLRAAGYRFEPILGGDVDATTEVLCLPAERGAPRAAPRSAGAV